MKRVPVLSWGLLVGAISLSPIVLIFGLPLAVGCGLDIFEYAGRGPIVFALSIPIAFALMTRLMQPYAAHWLAAVAARPHLPLGHPAKRA